MELPATRIGHPPIGTSGARNVPALTGVRGAAALAVLAFHVWHLTVAILGRPDLADAPIIGQAWVGLDLFFVLSGFVLMHAHGQELAVPGRAALARFATLRFFRVYPLNAAVLVLIAIPAVLWPDFVSWARTVGQPGDFSPQAFARTLLVATRWPVPGRGEWNEPVWSLSVEVLGYAAFPAIALALARTRAAGGAIILAVLSLLVLLAVLTALGHAGLNIISKLAVLRMLGTFVAGAALARAWHLMPPRATRRWPATLVTGSTLFLLLCVCVPGLMPLAHFGLAGIVFGLAFGQGRISAVLSSPPMVWLGRISFPLYLAHLPAMLWLRYGHERGFIDAQLVVPGMAACVLFAFLIATLLHHVVEGPAHALGRRLAGERVQAQASAGGKRGAGVPEYRASR